MKGYIKIALCKVCIFISLMSSLMDISMLGQFSFNHKTKRSNSLFCTVYINFEEPRDEEG